MIGNGFAGTIDDVSYYDQMLDESTIKGIWKTGFLCDKGIFEVRADNDNTLFTRIDGGTVRQRFPLFLIDNYWGAAKPLTGCVRLNGAALTRKHRLLRLALDHQPPALDRPQPDRLSGLDAPLHRRLVVKRLARRDPDEAYGLGQVHAVAAVVLVPELFGKLSRRIGHEPVLFRMEVRQYHHRNEHDARRRGVQVQELEPVGVRACRYVDDEFAYVYKRTPGRHAARLPELHAGLNVKYPISVYASAVPTYSVVESSLVRIQLQLNERTIGAAGQSAMVTTRWTIYPTGQIFRWDSVQLVQQPAETDLVRQRLPEIYCERGI
jgi:hypothetical protein